MTTLESDRHWLNWGSAVVGDALRSQGYHFQTMDGGIRPVWSGARLVGRALTVRTYPGATWALEQVLELVTEGDVLVVNAGGRPDVIIMGELMSMRAKQRGAAGVVVDGAVRDVKEVAAMSFPMFARYICPGAGTHDRIGEWGKPIACGSVLVQPGDLIIGDESGVVAVPSEATRDVATAAEALKAKERRMIEGLARGLTWSQAAEQAAPSPLSA